MLLAIQMRRDLRAAVPASLRLCSACCLLCATTCAGCNERSPGRVAAEGTVSCDGKPLAEGTILFVPSGSTTGPKAGGTIENGHFAIPADHGPLVGKLRVEIRRETLTAPQKADSAKEGVAGTSASVARLKDLPERYNRASTLIIETHPDQLNHFDFQLITSP
jgi:hypothetical protein